MALQEKPSKTCTCDWLKNAAEDARFPIEYDRESNEFKLCCQLDDGEIGYTVLHYCPFCGGKAPDVRKAQSFAQLSEQEFLRLQELTQQIKSIEDAFRILGKPEIGEPELTQAEQELLQAARSLTYQNVSESATIHITEYEQGNIRIVIQEKFIGKQPSE
ncbi:DUF6980 family protein [Kaarinaea lacus]